MTHPHPVTWPRLTVVFLTCAVAIGSPCFVPDAYAAPPETVMVTLHATPGAEADLTQVLARHKETVLRLNLVQTSPYLTLRGLEAGSRTYFVIVMTWRDASIPDAAPAEVQAIWQEMSKCVEARAGKPGIEITEMTLMPE